MSMINNAGRKTRNTGWTVSAGRPIHIFAAGEDLFKVFKWPTERSASVTRPSTFHSLGVGCRWWSTGMLDGVGKREGTTNREGGSWGLGNARRPENYDWFTISPASLSTKTTFVKNHAYFCMVRAEWGGRLGRRWLPRQGRGQKGAIRGKRVYCKSLPVQCDGNLRRLS